MSSFSSPPPLTAPFEFRRKSSSASTSVSMDNHVYGLGDAALSSSPLLSPSPLPTPVHLARRYECTEWQSGDYPDDLAEVIYPQQDRIEDATHSWLCYARPKHPLPNIHRPLPALMTKFVARALQDTSPLSYNPSPFSSTPDTTTAYLFPQGDSAIADDCEEYDLESMDIHIRETYFATSAERGRWLSSPVAPRVRSRAIPPKRGHSSPIKTPASVSPSRDRLRRHKRGYSVGQQILTSSSGDCDEDVRCSSPLPPSSPLTSPMSSLSFLGGDYEEDFVGAPRSNSNDCHSPARTPELSISSTICTSPVEPTRALTPHEAPVVTPALHPTDPPPHSPGSVTSPCMSPSPSHSPTPAAVLVHAPNATSLELDCTPVPLSQLEFVEAEHSKLPLSDTVNKPYPGQHTPTLGVTVDAVRRQDGPSCIQSLSMNSGHEPLDVSRDAVDGFRSKPNKRVKKGKESTTGDQGTKRSKRRAVTRSGSSSFDTQKSRGSGGRMREHPEPPNKKSKLLDCGDDSERHGAKSHPTRSRVPKVERLSPPPSPPAVEGCEPESACSRNRKIPCAPLQQPTPGSPATLVPMDAVDMEFDVSLTGMLVEALATSRATSMDSAALCLVLARAHPHLVAERSKEELMMDVATALEAGQTRCGMFEKVDSSSEGTRRKALEGRWFYVPERDEDAERASLISAIMPRQKRNETKKYKQYYYRPLDKMCRWDPEDAP